MYHYLYFNSAIILILLNLYCYSSPIPYIEQQQTLSPIDSDEQEKKNFNNEMINPFFKNKNDQFYYLTILCAFYGDCYNKDQQDITNLDTKYKRLTSNLFHGFPKFGKRAFTSAFSGIPKFG